MSDLLRSATSKKDTKPCAPVRVCVEFVWGGMGGWVGGWVGVTNKKDTKPWLGVLFVSSVRVYMWVVSCVRVWWVGVVE